MPSINDLQNMPLSFPFRCVIAELFLEGQPLFELSQLLAYRRGQYDPSQYLEKVFSSFDLLTFIFPLLLYHFICLLHGHLFLW